MLRPFPSAAVPPASGGYIFLYVSDHVLYDRCIPGRGRGAEKYNQFWGYVAMFPQLIAGPIVRYQTISREMDNRKETADEFAQGSLRFLTGLGKKVLIANNIGLLWESSERDEVILPWLPGWESWRLPFNFILIFPVIRIWPSVLDGCLVFIFRRTFDYPYLAKSITHFWRRWHISLGTWFREYVYTSAGRQQKRKDEIVSLSDDRLGSDRNLAWGSCNFLLWGLYYDISSAGRRIFP